MSISVSKHFRFEIANISAFEDAWVSTTLARPSLGEALTGWRPKKMGLVDGVDLYWAAAKAHMQEQQ